MPRFLQYGPLLEPALRNLVAQGSGLREIGRTLHLDPKTVVRLAGELGISIAWKSNRPVRTKSTLANATAKTEISNVRLSKNMTIASDRLDSRKSLRHDWQKIDNIWLSKLSDLIALVLLETPPVRVSVAELERRANRRGWLLKRQQRLPKTMALLKLAVEKTEDFQNRRIQWAIAKLELCGGQVKAWQVMRKCGLRTNSLDRILALLEASPIASKVAA